MPSEEQPEQKPVVDKAVVDVPVKSSMEILSELFESFDAEPPVIVKKEKSDSPSKKGKKGKKKHKHKDKKHKKKDKKKKRSSSSSSDKSEIDLAEILIKQEKESSEKKIKIEGTDLSFNIDQIKKEKDAVKSEHKQKAEEPETKVKSVKEKKSEKSDKSKKSGKKEKDKTDKKIEIKLKTSSLETSKKNVEDGEVASSDDSSDDKKHKKRKHKGDHDHDRSKKKKHRSKSEERKDSKIRSDDLRNKLKSRRRSTEGRSRSRENRYSKDNDFYRSKDKEKGRDDDFYKGRDRDKDREWEHRFRDRDRDRDKHKEHDYKSRKGKDNPFYKEGDFYRSSKDYDQDKDGKSRDSFRYRGHDRDRDRRHRDRSGSRENSSHIDKKKLLEIARKNAIQMMKSGSLPGALTLGPQAQEKVIAAIKAGGKTIEELTDFCKTLSKKEEMGDLSSNPDENASDSDADVAFHHPFQIKDRPTTITMNIKNSVPLPLKSTQERTTELRIQFPVSSGQLHRKTESDWVPVAPKKSEPQSVKTSTPAVAVSTTAPLAIEAPPVKTAAVDTVAMMAGPQAFPVTTSAVNPAVDIGSIVSQRLSAMRKLQENPNDVQALTEIYKSNKEMQSWAQSKQQPGQFTGTTGAQVMSQSELSSGYQAWAKKDQLQSATPVSGGMGMHLLQKMGWKPGEGLGKEKTGALEPLLLEVKLDKKGLVANEEQKKKKKQSNPTQQWTTKSLQSKHPVSLLGEYASKRKLGAPQYTLCFECGPDHKKNFLFRVLLNGMEYKPNVASPNKKEAKATAATVCLQQLGLLPSQPLLQQS